MEISLEDNVLTILGEKRESREEGEAGNRFYLVERRFGASRRSFTLPRTVHSEGIKAEFHNGLLSVRLPKADEATSRKIEVSRKSWCGAWVAGFGAEQSAGFGNMAVRRPEPGNGSGARNHGGDVHGWGPATRA